MANNKRGFFQRIGRSFWGGVDAGDVLFGLSELNLKKADLISLAHVEKMLIKILSERFNNVEANCLADEQLDIRVSVDIEDEVGIICHFANDLSPQKMTDLIGKLVCLKCRTYTEPPIFIIIGTKRQKKLMLVKEAERICSKLNIGFHYLQAR